MPARWECRYSSCEMMYLEVKAREVILFLDHSPNKADHYTFDEVLQGAMDNEVGSVFGSDTLKALKAEVKLRSSERP